MTMLDPDDQRACLESIPVELRERPQWVLWRCEVRDGKPTKVPYQPSGAKASSTKAATWSTFDEVLAAERFDGIGFVLTEGIVFVDFDHCIDLETGEIDPDVWLWVQGLESYTERSPSGSGLHVLVRAHKPGPGCKKAFGSGEIEMYESGRYATVTGVHLEGTPPTIEARQGDLEDLYEEVFGALQTPNNGGKPSSAVRLGDRELLEKMLASKNGAKIEALYRGDASAYGDDESSADLALLTHFAWWTHNDAARMDSIFRTSGLYREKWERADYRERTITKAIEKNGGQGYTPPVELVDQDGPRVGQDVTPPSADGAAEDDKRFSVLRRGDVEFTRPVPVIPARVYRGTLCVIGGRQGEGKGRVVRDLLARATYGGPWPFGDPARFDPLTVIDFNAEDDPASVIFPEYQAAGGDFDRLHVVCTTRDGLPPHLSDPAQRLQLMDMIGDLRADLVTLDPASHFFPGLKFNETESVIYALGPMMSLAKRTGCTIVVVTHFNKYASNDALAKFLGSMQWTAIARSALGVVPDPDSEDEERERRQLWTVKNNLAPKRERPPWGFEIVENDERRCVVAWDSAKATSSEAAAFGLDTHHADSPLKGEIKKWLRSCLASGEPYPLSMLKEEAEAYDYSWDYVRKVADEVGVRKFSEGFKPRTHYWQLGGESP